jgi:hypothetical protein
MSTSPRYRLTLVTALRTIRAARSPRRHRGAAQHHRRPLPACHHARRRAGTDRARLPTQPLHPGRVVLGRRGLRSGRTPRAYGAIDRRGSSRRVRFLGPAMPHSRPTDRRWTRAAGPFPRPVARPGLTYSFFRLAAGPASRPTLLAKSCRVRDDSRDRAATAIGARPVR